MAFYLMETRGYGLAQGLGVTLLGGAIGGGLGAISWGFIGVASQGFIAALTSTGSSPRTPSFSRQESLIARGEYPAAADEFRAHLAEHPGDNAARLALADLLQGKLADPIEAERCFRTVLDGPASDNERFAAAGRLLDLYRRTGQQGRLMAELARFAQRYPGTVAGEGAKRELQDLKRSL